MYACWVSVYVCVCVCMHVIMSECVHAYLCVHANVCVCACKYRCVHVCVRVHGYVCMCMYAYITATCVSVYIYIYIEPPISYNKLIFFKLGFYYFYRNNDDTIKTDTIRHYTLPNSSAFFSNSLWARRLCD